MTHTSKLSDHPKDDQNMTSFNNKKNKSKRRSQRRSKRRSQRSKRRSQRKLKRQRKRSVKRSRKQSRKSKRSVKKSHKRSRKSVKSKHSVKKSRKRSVRTSARKHRKYHNTSDQEAARKVCDTKLKQLEAANINDSVKVKEIRDALDILTDKKPREGGLEWPRQCSGFVFDVDVGLERAGSRSPPHAFDTKKRSSKKSRKYKVGDEYEPGLFDSIIGDMYPIAQGDFMNRVRQKEELDRRLKIVGNRAIENNCLDSCREKCKRSTNISYIDDSRPLTRDERRRVQSGVRALDNRMADSKAQEALLLEDWGSRYGDFF